MWGWRPRSALALALLAGCGEVFLALPNDFGTVRVTVLDEGGAPVGRAAIAVQMRTNAGSFYEVIVQTPDSGVVSIGAVTPGRRRVTVTPPVGYTAGDDTLQFQVDVEKAKTVDVQRRLRRVAGS